MANNITEDSLANALVVDARNNDAFDDILLEVSYNHYGNRGVVDFVADGNYTLVTELKSDHAINEVTGANEIIRQFNRHRKYFFEGSSIRPSNPSIFELCFSATPESVEHIIKNWNLYLTMLQSDVSEVNVKTGCRLGIRSPDPSHAYAFEPFEVAKHHGETGSPPPLEESLENAKMNLTDQSFNRIRDSLVELLA